MINLGGLRDIEQVSELAITDFYDLAEIVTKGHHEITKITKVTISNCPQLAKVNIREFKNNKELKINACPKLEEFNCGGNQLTELDLSNFSNLKDVRCGYNKLSKLKLSKSTQLERLECDNNQLVVFEYSNLNPKRLTQLNMSDNNLMEQDLSVFSELINLEFLEIGNSKASITTGNKFLGSLKFLKDMTNLKGLNVVNTNVESGLEYLPDSLE
jgi:Leucine-rich repeat (LRR) protein